MMTNEKCVLDIMESKGYIEIKEGLYSREELPMFYIHVSNTIKDKDIREEMYIKLYKKLRDSNKYIIDPKDSSHDPYFYRKEDVINFIESFIESGKEKISDEYKPDYVCEFINNNFDCIEIANNNYSLINKDVRKQRIQKEKRQDIEALELLNNIL